MELTGAIQKQDFKLAGSSGNGTYVQCEGCLESEVVDNLDAAVKWADQHEIDMHIESPM